MDGTKVEQGPIDDSVGPDHDERSLKSEENAERDPLDLDQVKPVEESEKDAIDATAKEDPAGEDKVDAEVGEAQEISELKTNLSELSVTLVDTENRLLRALADTENVRRRAVRDVENAQKFGIEALAGSLLTVLDNFDRALDFLHDTAADGQVSESIVEGIELTRKSLLDALSGSGIKDLSPLGEAFDPGRHKAMSMIPNSGKPAGSVIEVIRKGYMLHDRLLREAEVMVAAPDPKDAVDELPGS